MPSRRILRTALATTLAAVLALPGPAPSATARPAAGARALLTALTDAQPHPGAPDAMPGGTVLAPPGPGSGAAGRPPGALVLVPPGLAPGEVGPRPGGASGADRPPEPVLRAPVQGPVVRGFEPPASDFGPGHRGVDFAVRPGTPVAAPAAGSVVFAGQVAGVLWVAITLSPAALLSIGPLAELRVRSGQWLRAGDVIGLAGGEGAVHLGLRVAGAYTDPLPHLVRARRPRLVPLTGPGARATVAPVPPSPRPVAPGPSGAQP